MKSNKTINIFTRAICWHKLVTEPISFENRSHLVDTCWNFNFRMRKKFSRFWGGEDARVGRMGNGPWRKTMSSRCNSYCWPPAVSRWTDRFAGFSRLLRNHQSYSAIWSDVAPRDTCAIGRCPFFCHDHPQFFHLSTPSTNYTRFCIMYRNIIQLFICPKFAPSWTRAFAFESYIDRRAIRT